jgi:hypothetical protein
LHDLDDLPDKTGFFVHDAHAHQFMLVIDPLRQFGQMLSFDIDDLILENIRFFRVVDSIETDQAPRSADLKGSDRLGFVISAQINDFPRYKPLGKSVRISIQTSPRRPWVFPTFPISKNSGSLFSSEPEVFLLD